ncbi:MAG TPA: LysR family transcriptional regulator [Verrucomicrobiales bacterium]|nr:LysR family transcriptional regulator [Verrucomicrobiales bacterium]
MNVHHLELFYYVARFQGISEAVRNIPYGIQQPAVSGQIIALEDFLGVKLFQRRPFALSPAGEELYEFIKPFFSNLESVTARLQGGVAHHIRIGASEIVLRDHVPLFVTRVKEKFPGLRMTLREGYQQQIEAWLERGEIDLGFTVLGERPPNGIQNKPLLTLPLVLLVPRSSRVRSAGEIFGQDRIEQPLINMPAHEAIARNFQKGLARLGVDWFPSIEVSSLHLIETFVANGHGIGLFVDLPAMKPAREIRVLPLPDFSPVVFGALWKGRPSPIIQAFLDEAQARSVEVSRPR